MATISPNTHAQLECFYSVPQLGAVLAPINYRLTPEDFVYIVNHSGATVVCVAEEYLAAVDGIRDQMPEVRHFVALEGSIAGGGWLDYEAAIAGAEPGYTNCRRPRPARSRSSCCARVRPTSRPSSTWRPGPCCFVCGSGGHDPRNRRQTGD